MGQTTISHPGIGGLTPFLAFLQDKVLKFLELE